ncbi:MAG: hypothetical protein COU90_04285 [Candidatus Ryanbacteria bacterium CG10_big_fil_rev_8_21_14_0_10_43_42]|uniref:Uncharacterized protein n=1 Tax=Candidatus Ryanbacteria bacterium CG10_big_fil_rev_8_21_14_0_10_43_42 TaxID=1974864 RepID=A0A2M8KVX8_9BACT|nr:MAG: hypothetical protein COU90_04285 [Candidatus Ryanbacteria bacterium CG10_big_fil_rev_8_21_14_0_10_43_42]
MSNFFQYQTFKESAMNLFEQILVGFNNGEWGFLFLYFFVIVLLFVITPTVGVITIVKFFQSGKKLKIEPIWKSRSGKPMVILSVSNVGAKGVYLEYYGFTKWNGEKVKEPVTHVELYKKFEPNDARKQLSFYSDIEGKPLELNMNDIYYFYVTTSVDDIFKKYNKPPIIRGIVWCYKRLKLIP